MHAAADLPLRQTVALVAEAGGPSLSPMRLHKKMIRASEYLHLLVTAMVDTPMGLAPEKLLMHSARSIPNCSAWYIRYGATPQLAVLTLRENLRMFVSEAAVAPFVEQ